MTTTFTVADLTIHRVLESEGPLLPALDAFPDLDPKVLATPAAPTGCSQQFSSFLLDHV